MPINDIENKINAINVCIPRWLNWTSALKNLIANIKKIKILKIKKNKG